MANFLHPGRKEKVYRPRINPLDEFDERTFAKRYRVSKTIARDLSERYRQSGCCGYSGETRRGMGVSAEERMCLALRYLATGANYSIVGDFQGVSKSTVSKSLHEVLDFFDNVVDEYIEFPNTLEARAEASTLFYNKFGRKPLVLGCVDGTHIPILAPRQNEVDFVNRKGFHSINTMLIVGADRRVFLVDPSFPGAVHDSFVLQSNDVWQDAIDGNLGDYILLGDSGYPLSRFLFTPIANPLTEADRRFNRWHMGARVIVEQTIGHLKQRFRCLDRHGGYLYHSPLDCTRIINVCAALHNLCLDARVPLPNEEDEEDVRPQPLQRVPQVNPLGPPPHAGHTLQEGRARRERYITANFV